MPNSRNIRVSKEFKKIINFILADCIVNGRKRPTTSQITELIAKNTDKDKILRMVKNEIIRF